MVPSEKAYCRYAIGLDADAVKIRELRRAVNSADCDDGTPSLTFVSVLNHSGTSSNDLILSLGYSLDRTLHGEENIEYFGTPITAGESLFGEIYVKSIERKVGRSGEFDLISIAINFWTASGEKVVSIERKLISEPIQHEDMI